MIKFSEIIIDLQNDDDFCSFTEEELVDIVAFVKENQGEDAKDEFLNKPSGDTRGINKERC